MNKPVALISDHASPLAATGGVDAGGQNVAVAELACALARLGYEVDIFTRRTSPAEPEIVEWQPRIRVVHIQAGPLRWVPKETLLPHMDEFADRMLGFIRGHGLSYQLIHAHFFMSGLVALRLRPQLNIPFVVTFHALGLVRRLFQGASDGFPTERIDLEKRLVREANGLIALCPQDSTDLIRLYGADPDKITIVPNGYSPADFFPVDQAIARQLIGVGSDQPLLLQLGRLVPRKGIATVIQALERLHRTHQIRARLLIVGGDAPTPDPALTPEIGRLQQLADGLDVSDCVQFVGSRQRHELRYYYSAADVFVTTPVYEPFGITPLEAMACETPVVGSAVGGIKHTVLANKTGFLVPPNDPAALADRLAVLLTNNDLRRRYGQAAAKHVNSGYTWQQVARQTAHLYNLLTNGRVQTGLWLGTTAYSLSTLYKSGDVHE